MSEFTLLGIAIRARWLGFVQLDARKHLLDWGMAFYQPRKANEVKAAKKRLDAMLTRMNPSFVVLAPPALKAHREHPSIRSIARSLQSAASSRSIRIISLRLGFIRAAFAPHNAKSKHEIAVALVQVFPELSSKLPPKRKIWSNQDPRMAIFDALAGAVTYHDSTAGTVHLRD